MTLLDAGGPGFLPGGVRLALLYNVFYSAMAHNKEVYEFDVKTTYWKSLYGYKSQLYICLSSPSCSR